MVHYQSEFPTADGQCTEIYFGDEVVGCSLYSFFRPLSRSPSLPISAPKISNYEPAGGRGTTTTIMRRDFSAAAAAAFFALAAMGDRNRVGGVEVTACNTITNFGGRREEKQVFYRSGESNRRSRLKRDAGWMSLSFWAPDFPGQIRPEF